MVSQEDNHTTKQDEGEIVVENTIMANLNSSEVLQPGKQALNLPTFFISAQRTPILSGRFLPVGLVRSDQLDALLLQALIQQVAVISFVTDQSFWLFFGEPLLQGVFHQGHFMRRSTSNGYGEMLRKNQCHLPLP